jgi:hypothetical protein
VSCRERAKGLRGEREVAVAFEQAGFEVRNLEMTGDQLVVCQDGLTLHGETKRQERLRLPEWTKQAEAESPPGAVPFVAYRASREPWRVSLRLDDFLRILGMAVSGDRPVANPKIMPLTTGLARYMDEHRPPVETLDSRKV